ncbi:MAG TPA: arylesterase [Acidobacteriaceae bacterium]
MISGCHSNSSSNSVANSQPEPVTAPTSAAADEGARAPAAKAVDANDRRPVLVCFGDSLTAGLGTESGQSYPDYLQVELDRLHYHYRVDNEGVSGDTTKDGVERLPTVLALHPEVVVVEFGGNDGLRGLRVEDTRANLDEIVSTLQKAGIKVALAGITLPPDYGPDYIQKFNETYSMLAKKYRVPMLPFLLKDVYGVPGMMQRDNTHATAKGNAIVAKNVVPLVTPLLKR